MAVNFAFAWFVFCSVWRFAILPKPYPYFQFMPRRKPPYLRQTKQKDSGVRQKDKPQCRTAISNAQLHFIPFTHPPVTKRWRRIGYNYSLRYSTQQRAGTFRSATDGDGNTHCLPFRVDKSILHYGKECSSFQLNRPLIVRRRARACSLRCSAPLTTAIAYAPRVTVRKISARKKRLFLQTSMAAALLYTFSEIKAVRKISSASRQDISREPLCEPAYSARRKAKIEANGVGRWGVLSYTFRRNLRCELT